MFECCMCNVANGCLLGGAICNISTSFLSMIMPAEHHTSDVGYLGYVARKSRQRPLLFKKSIVIHFSIFDLNLHISYHIFSCIEMNRYIPRIYILKPRQAKLARDAQYTCISVPINDWPIMSNLLYLYYISICNFSQ